jgi:hypothetical protein
MHAREPGWEDDGSGRQPVIRFISLLAKWTTVGWSRLRSEGLPILFYTLSSAYTGSKGVECAEATCIAADDRWEEVVRGGIVYPVMLIVSSLEVPSLVQDRPMWSWKLLSLTHKGIV